MIGRSLSAYVQLQGACSGVPCFRNGVFGVAFLWGGWSGSAAVLSNNQSISPVARTTAISREKHQNTSNGSSRCTAKAAYYNVRRTRAAAIRVIRHLTKKNCHFEEQTNLVFREIDGINRGLYRRRAGRLSYSRSRERTACHSCEWSAITVYSVPY